MLILGESTAIDYDSSYITAMFLIPFICGLSPVVGYTAFVLVYFDKTIYKHQHLQ